MKNLIFVDCEASGPVMGIGELTEFGAVHYPSRATFHGVLIEHNPKEVFQKFSEWLDKVCVGSKPIFISDNPAFDWQWINYGFWHYLGRNPFGHSARRIGDFYAGLIGDFRDSQSWKGLRITSHDHNPVHDAMGNLEAFVRLLNGENKKIKSRKK